MEAAAKRAKEASFQLAVCSNEDKNEVLDLFRQLLIERRAVIEKANEEDIKIAGETGVADQLVSRLSVKGGKFEALLAGITDVIGMPDPCGLCDVHTELAEGLELYRVSCPIGVLGVIYESRPDAGVQITSLCLKAGCSLLLKGGKEATKSNHVIFETLQMALAKAKGNVPKDCVQLLDTREDVTEMLKQTKWIDLVVARGSYDLVRYVKHNTQIPVLGHADGLCSVYVDQHADLAKAVAVVEDAKMNYPSGCNAMETLLVHAKVADSFLPALHKKMPSDVKFHCCPTSLPLVPGGLPASEESYATEFLAHEMAVKIVQSVEEAIIHINAHGSSHTDVVITEDNQTCQKFMSCVDSAGVFCNASSRFADGFRFGFGAELGISTGKLHARGPVGLEGLMSYKYKLFGTGDKSHTVGGGVSFTHKPILQKATIPDPARGMAESHE